MVLYCEKYAEKVPSETAVCKHPREYCKFRSACMIQFVSRDKPSKTQALSNKPPKDEVAKVELQFKKGNGLLPAIAQDAETNQVLMLAYINEEAWRKTLETGKAHYWSRSRNQLWLKGESSNHVQLVKEIYIDCDADTVIFKVEQLGGAACHKGYKSCFFRRIENNTPVIVEKQVFNPEEVYKK